MSQSPIVRQTWVVAAVLMSMLGQGMVLGYTSSMLAALQAPGSPVPVSAQAASWIVAALGVGTLFGYLHAGAVMARCGRRAAFRSALLPGLAGTLLLATASDVRLFVAARALCGATAGASCTAGAVAIGEYCSPRHRGMFLNLKTSGLYVGSLLVHALGALLPWRMLGLLCTAPYALALAASCGWSESPSWLAQRRRFDESERVFYRLRGRGEDAVRELEELIAAQKEAGPPEARPFSERAAEFLRKFTRRNFIMPALTSMVAAILLEASGRHLFPAYAAQIVGELTGDAARTLQYTLGADVLIAGSSLLSVGLVRAVRLRPLLFWTGGAAAGALAGAGVAAYLARAGPGGGGGAAAPVALFALFCVLANLGCAPVPLALMGEIFPLEHRAAGVSLAGYMICLFLTLTLKATPAWLAAWGVHGLFAALATVIALSLLALFFTLPETKGRTLQQIEASYRRGRPRCATPGESAGAGAPDAADTCLCEKGGG